MHFYGEKTNIKIREEINDKGWILVFSLTHAPVVAAFKWVHISTIIQRLSFLYSFFLWMNLADGNSLHFIFLYCVNTPNRLSNLSLISKIILKKITQCFFYQNKILVTTSIFFFPPCHYNSGCHSTIWGSPFVRVYCGKMLGRVIWVWLWSWLKKLMLIKGTGGSFVSCWKYPLRFVPFSFIISFIRS